MAPFKVAICLFWSTRLVQNSTQNIFRHAISQIAEASPLDPLPGGSQTPMDSNCIVLFTIIFYYTPFSSLKYVYFKYLSTISAGTTRKQNLKFFSSVCLQSERSKKQWEQDPLIFQIWKVRVVVVIFFLIICFQSLVFFLILFFASLNVDLRLYYLIYLRLLLKRYAQR